MTTVCFDVDTQIDFLYPAGALYVPGAERIVRRIGDLNRWAAARGSVVVSTMDAHAEDDPEFRDWPAHCVKDTYGQMKPQETLLERRVVIPSDPSAVDRGDAQQIIVEKQALDCFTNRNLPAVLERLHGDRYVVYGVVTEICVKMAAFGLLDTGKPVEIVMDAVRHLNEAEAKKMLDEFQSRGGKLTTLAEVTR